MYSKNFDIEILSLNHVQFRVDYYSSNKEHLEIWHPTTPNEFYTFKYQKNKINEQLKLVNNGKSSQFVIVNKAKTKMLGHCNYTKIKDSKCWFGSSISKVFEGKSLMYEALILTNAYVMKNLRIKEIRAGILPNNDKSIRLIKRFDFKYIGETRTYETYLFSA